MTALDSVRAVLLDAEHAAADRFALYRLAADAAIDDGDEGLARGLTWLADNERWPAHGADLDPQKPWLWFAWKGQPFRRESFHHHLPPEAVRAVRDSQFRESENALTARYVAFPDAVLDAARAAGNLGL